MVWDYLRLKRVWNFGVRTQIVLLILAVSAYVALGYTDYLRTGLIFGYPALVSIFIMPIVEEIVFRGLIFVCLVQRFSVMKSIVFSSILFGLFHLKNLLFIEPSQVFTQIFYTGLLVGPILAWVTYKSKSIWPAVILHYMHNVLAFGVVIYL